MSSYLNAMYIDETALDVEWLGQAELATEWGLKWSEAKEEFQRAEENVKVVRSELTIRINKNPEKYLGEGVKLTDPKVEAAYRTHPKYKAAKERWIEAMRNLNDIEIAKNEISFTRKAALENLVTLHGQSYFAGPKTPRNLRSERRDREKTRKERNKKVRRINRKNK